MVLRCARASRARELRYKGGRTPRAARLDPSLRFKYARDKNLLDITIFISFQGVLGHRGELYIITRGQGSGGWREGWWIAMLPLIKGGIWVPYNHLENISGNYIWKVDVI